MAGRVRNTMLSCAAWALLAAASSAGAQDDKGFDTSAGNLLAVLRESAGENKLQENLQPYGAITVALPDGKRAQLAMSWYQYLGDMHIRLVFDGGQHLQSASPSDLERLKLTPEEALAVAVANMRRLHGRPQAVPYMPGLMQVQGGSPDLASSYFLDREFWLQLQREHPEGVVAAVPRRGGLVYAPANDEDAIDTLRFSAAALFAGGGGTRVSSALYLFKDGAWSVWQPPQPQ